MKVEKEALYPIFIVMYSIVAVATIWNIREQHKLRKLQKKELANKVGNA